MFILLFVTGCTNQANTFNTFNAFSEGSINIFKQLENIDKEKPNNPLPSDFVDQGKIEAYKEGFTIANENLSFLEAEIAEFFHYFETLDDKKWQTEISQRKYQSSKIIKDVTKLTPPEEWESFHSVLIRTAMEYDRAIHLLEQYIENDRNLIYLKASKNALKQGLAQQNHLREVYNNGVSGEIVWETKSIYN